MTSKEKKLYAVFTQVRTCFNQLKMLAEQLHKDLDINPSMRAVMEALLTNGRQTVPEIANNRSVSRQHIQNIMNALLADELVESFDNPAHKRSPLFDLTRKGRTAFALIKEREKEPIRRLADVMSSESLHCLQVALGELNIRIAHQITQGDSNGNPSS